MIKTAIDVESGKVFLLDTTESGEDMTPAQESLDIMASQINTIKTDQGDLGDQVHDIQGDVNSLKNNAVTKTGSQVVDGKTLTNTVIKNILDVRGDEAIGEMFQVDFLDGTTQVATNNGMDFLSDVNFVIQPTTESVAKYEDVSLDSLVTKQQVAQAITDVTGTHFEKWVVMGVPDSIELTTSLQKMYMPATTRFPNIPPADIEPNSNGTGIIFKREGLVHIKRNVSLGGSNTENLYYEARINDERLEPLLAQAVSVSENTMNYSIEFYWYVYPNQEFSIWANCLKDTCTLNFKGVTTVIEYL